MIVIPGRTLQSDPLRNFKFIVSIPLVQNGVPHAMSTLGFMQVQGLGMTIEPLTYREGGDNITTRKMPGQADFNPITLSRGLFPGDWQTWYWVWELFSVLYGTSSASDNSQPASNPPYVAGSQAPNFRTNIYINVLEHPNNSSQAQDPAKLSVLSIQLYNAWPTTFSISDFDAGANAVSIEQMQLAYEGFQIAYGTDGSGYVTNSTAWSY